eukprot:m51a1_g6862 putative glycerophosphodiester phosphodiesterase domain-containing protein 5 isoform x2 (488) ;mRNA; r:140134-143038
MAEIDIPPPPLRPEEGPASPECAGYALCEPSRAAAVPPRNACRPQTQWVPASRRAGSLYQQPTLHVGRTFSDVAPKMTVGSAPGRMAPPVPPREPQAWHLDSSTEVYEQAVDCADEGVPEEAEEGVDLAELPSSDHILVGNEHVAASRAHGPRKRKPPSRGHHLKVKSCEQSVPDRPVVLNDAGEVVERPRPRLRDPANPIACADMGSALANLKKVGPPAKRDPADAPPAPAHSRAPREPKEAHETKHSRSESNKKMGLLRKLLNTLLHKRSKPEELVERNILHEQDVPQPPQPKRGDKQLLAIWDLREPLNEHRGDWLDIVFNVTLESTDARSRSLVWWLDDGMADRARRAGFRRACPVRHNEWGGALGRPCDVLNVKHDVSGAELRRAKATRLWVNVYVVDSEWLFAQMWMLGVNSVTTTNPAAMARMATPVWVIGRGAYRLLWVSAELLCLAAAALQLRAAWRKHGAYATTGLPGVAESELQLL